MATGKAASGVFSTNALSSKATESRTPSPPSLSSQELLGEMVASTQRLDGILHGLCASSQRAAQHQEGERDDAAGLIVHDNGHSGTGRVESFEVTLAGLYIESGQPT